MKPFLIPFVRKRDKRFDLVPFRVALKDLELPRAPRTHQELPCLPMTELLDDDVQQGDDCLFERRRKPGQKVMDRDTADHYFRSTHSAQASQRFDQAKAHLLLFT